jgi:hypothetical protein
MKSLEWIPELNGTNGSFSTDGFTRLLGASRMDRLAILVRETAQNSWDARLSETGEVGFHMSGFRLSAKQHQVLTHEVFTGEFEQVVPNLERVMGGEPPLVLCVSDRNTKGLGGPVDGNSADPNRIYDWRHFVLDMGHRNTDGHTGGTYGFGKTIAYIVSKAGTVLIHSRALGVGSEGISSRFIACAIGHDFDLDGLLYTGRHFWGVNDGGLGFLSSPMTKQVRP